MKVLLTAVSAFALFATPAIAQTPPGAPAQASSQADSPAEESALPSPPKISRWENTGMTPLEADRLIRPIREAWVEIGPQVARGARA